MLILKIQLLIHKTILWKWLENLAEKYPVKSSGCVNLAKKEIQQCVSRTHSQENDLLDLFPEKNDTDPQQIRSS